jgi:hypothetical protein
MNGPRITQITRMATKTGEIDGLTDATTPEKRHPGKSLIPQPLAVELPSNCQPVASKFLLNWES